jgi:hypothetical protein
MKQNAREIGHPLVFAKGVAIRLRHLSDRDLPQTNEQAAAVAEAVLGQYPPGHTRSWSRNILPLSVS